MSAGGSRTAAVRLRRAARDGSGPVRLLALHGLAGSGAVWRKYERLAVDQVEFWAAELPWGSEGHVGWSHSGDPVDHVDHALDSVPGGVDVLVAHSFATGPALEALARRDGHDRPRAAVIVSPFHRRSPGDFSWDDAAYYLGGFHHLLHEGLRITSEGRLSDEMCHDVALRVRDRIGPYGWQQFFGAYLRSPFLDVAALGLPVLVVAGEDDVSVSADDARALAGALPDARIELFGDCGHFAMVEQPRRFAAAVHRLIGACFPEAAPRDRPYVPELT
ncbi:alpha/beta hydrolase [Streptomyces sp. ISL-98]|uniref:alpha/beta fold hydrolase n=1 Tax=Streptomyces sp. ISL-98 TaxID=2819192 RepID=UPI001BEBCD0E|nr:alpha/beta fold hydrolase [Streptomyces sp. ISL-98]MBT2510617.1 alpha/beta hydrolase [Streptomyces sp. ISL-98]